MTPLFSRFSIMLNQYIYIYIYVGTERSLKLKTIMFLVLMVPLRAWGSTSSFAQILSVL